MAKRSVQLYLYADLPGIEWRYCRAVFGANNNLKSHILLRPDWPRKSRERTLKVVQKPRPAHSAESVQLRSTRFHFERAPLSLSS
jgi:hypothetical protein